MRKEIKEKESWPSESAKFIYEKVKVISQLRKLWCKSFWINLYVYISIIYVDEEEEGVYFSDELRINFFNISFFWYLIFFLTNMNNLFLLNLPFKAFVV